VRIGIIAPEFPPEVGGMQVMGLRIAEHLAVSHDVTVCTRRELGAMGHAFRLLQNLQGRTQADIVALQAVDAEVDVWLAMNAGYTAIATKLSKPLVAYFHGNDFLNPWAVSSSLVSRAFGKIPVLRKVWQRRRCEDGKAQIRAGLAATAKVLTNSKNTAALIRECYPEFANVYVCPPGVEERFFAGKLIPERAAGDLRLLTVSRLQKGTRRKNIAGVLRALALLKGRVNFKYAVVGDGDDLENLTRLGASLGLAEQVEFLGRLKDEALLKLYQESSLFILAAKASAVDVEGFGIVYLEANAAGVPVLCSAAGGAIDAVIDGKTGIVLKSSEPESIAQGILRFVETRADYQPEELREFAARFRWRVMATEIENQILSCRAGDSTEAVIGNHAESHGVAPQRAAVSTFS
jgi:glycosyltransferase involved in cell wall biosynthesis